MRACVALSLQLEGQESMQTLLFYLLHILVRNYVRRCISQTIQSYTLQIQLSEVATAGDTIAQGIGLTTIIGIAQPQPSPYAWLLVGLAVRE